MTARAALEIRGLDKRFGTTHALRGVDFRVDSGEIHALVGHNGSGKSTLIKIIAGVHKPEAGRITISGTELPPGDGHSAQTAGLRFVHQDLAVIDTLNAVDNLALGYGYTKNRLGTISWPTARQRARDTLETLGHRIDIGRPAGELLPAERVCIAIGRALQEWHGKANVLVLDEPTAAMPAPEVAKLFQVMRRLRDRGLAIIFVTHHLDEVLEIADRATVLQDGRNVAVTSTAGMTHDRLARLVLGSAEVRSSSGTPSTRILTTAIPAPDDRSGTGGAHKAGGEIVLRTDNLETPLIHGVSLSVRRGEIVGIAGLSGSGREELFPALAGAIPRRGAVTVQGRVIPPHRPHRAAAAGLGYVPGERLRNGLIPDLDVGANLTLAGLRAFRRAGLLWSGAELAETRRWLTDLQVRPDNPALPIAALSGGNQQKVMVGRWLRVSPAVMLLDEPTQGVDIGARAGIHQALRTAVKRNVTLVVASSDAEELALLCDRVLVLVRGRPVAELSGSTLTAGNIDAACMTALSSAKFRA